MSVTMMGANDWPDADDETAGTATGLLEDLGVASGHDPVTAVGAAVSWLGRALPALLDHCTDPEATDMAQMLADVRDARIALQGLERDVEVATAKAMLGDQALTPTLRVERERRPDRKAWDHQGWRSEARAKVVQAMGLKGAQGVIDAAGEVLPAEVLHKALAAVDEVHGSAPPRLTQLRGLGVDPDDYCERSPGAWKVTVTRMANETEGAD